MLSDEEEKKRKRNQMIAVFMTIPFVLAVPPIIGGIIGKWLDKEFNTNPFLLYAFLILGFIAAARECYRIIKKYSKDEN